MSKEIKVESRYLDCVKVGQLQARYSADGTRILRYHADFWHNKLGLHKDLSAPELYLLQGKVDQLMVSWDKKMDEHTKRASISNGKEAAESMEIDAHRRLESLSSILTDTLKVNDRINWEAIKDRSAFNESAQYGIPRPWRKRQPEPQYEPPSVTFWDKISGGKKRKLRKAIEIHKAAVKEWEASESEAEARISKQIADWEAKKAEFEAGYSARKAVFLSTQAERNARIDELAHGLKAGDTRSIIEHATMVLDRSDYGDLFEKSFDIDYAISDRIILVSYTLPSPSDMPTVKSVRFITSTGEIKQSHISEREKTSNYDNVCYQICLRTVHEIFESDEFENVDKVLFNGIASYVDISTGQDVSSCIMSVLVSKSQFDKIELRRVDPKACFKSLKGVSASSLAALAPVPPIMDLNREDRRFIEGRNTVDALTEATNLAAMDWADFEHLVRELFEKEFASRGGEVRITQASSDGGVDAVAFDPDPITGGKIVIQAKRYTKTVGVNAVRDLFGTMQHEGASRGILITTADFGPDAYSFASGKPITLFTGANLLYLLEKHGYRAKIDIREARKSLNLHGYG